MHAFFNCLFCSWYWLLDVLDKHAGAISAIATIVIAAFTIALAISTQRLWNEAKRASRIALRSAKATGDAARAAVTSVQAARDEFIATHRPRIRVKHLFLQSDVWDMSDVKLTLSVVNHGNTEAVHIHGELAIFVVPAIDYLPAKPTFSGKQVFVIQPDVCQSGVTIEFAKLSGERSLTANEIVSIRTGGSQFCCVGYVQYQDASGRIRKTAFCRVLKLLPLVQGETGRFVEPESPNSDYEYEYED